MEKLHQKQAEDVMQGGAVPDDEQIHNLLEKKALNHLPLLIHKSTVSQTLWNTMLPFSISSCWYYYFTILHTLWEWLYLSKKKPAVYSRTTDFLYYSFYLLRCVSDKFSIFKHSLVPSRYPSSLLSAPITFAMDCATEGFSAITNFIFFSRCV